MVKKYKKRIGQYVGAGMMLGAGYSVLGNMGTPAAPVLAGMQKGAGMFGAVGTAMGGSAVIRMVGKKSKKYTKRY